MVCIIVKYRILNIQLNCTDSNSVDSTLSMEDIREMTVRRRNAELYEFETRRVGGRGRTTPQSTLHFALCFGFGLGLGKRVDGQMKGRARRLFLGFFFLCFLKKNLHTC